MFLALFGSSQSASFQCGFAVNTWGYLGTVYRCDVPNSVNITSLDAVQVDDISGTHVAGYNNDNVEAFDISKRGPIHYFPHGINKFFTNIKGIAIRETGLKEIHQSDLKDFPKLVELWLYFSDLEILEENLFEFNPNLNLIELSSNKIKHIDPKVFDNLIKLKTLNLVSNKCIDMFAHDPIQFQNIIKTAQAQCTNLDYSNLEQKVKYLELESKFLNSENLREKFENLENLIKNSKFPNFFQEKLQNLNAVLNEKEIKDQFFDIISAITRNSSFEMCSALESKVNNVTKNVKDLVALTSNQTDNSKAEFVALNDKLLVQDIKISGIEEKLEQISEAIEKINKNCEEQNKRFLNLMNALEIAFSAGH